MCLHGERTQPSTEHAPTRRDQTPPMPITRRLRIDASDDQVLTQGLARIRQQMHLPDAVPAEVSELPPGWQITMKLLQADPATRCIRFELE